MALPSKQITPTHVLDSYLARMVSLGYSVGENPRHGTKRVTKGVHRADSFHYAGLAADINFGGNGAAERAKLISALNEAVALGLSVTFARDGRVGSAANHANHLHVDVGEWSNFGKGLVRTTAKSSGNSTAQIQARLNRDYPAYSNLVVDGIPGARTTAAIKEFQRRSGLVPDGIAGPLTRAKLGL